MNSEEYRLSWEMPASFEVAQMENFHGKDVWIRIGWVDEAFASWHTVTKVTTNPWEQYNTLQRWALTREQPIRNVVLEKRERPQVDDGWTIVLGAL